MFFISPRNSSRANAPSSVPCYPTEECRITALVWTCFSALLTAHSWNSHQTPQKSISLCDSQVPSRPWWDDLMTLCAFSLFSLDQLPHFLSVWILYPLWYFFHSASIKKVRKYMSEHIMTIPWFYTNKFIARKGARTCSHGIWSPLSIDTVNNIRIKCSVIMKCKLPNTSPFGLSIGPWWRNRSYHE